MISLLGTIINVIILTYLARRLLAIPVGWGRVLIVSLIVNGIPYLGQTGTATVDAGGWAALGPLMAYFGITEDTPLLPMLLVIGVLTGCIIALQLVILTVLEVIIPTRNVPSVTSLVTGFPAAVRRARRYLSIWWIAVRRGLTAYLGPSPRTGAETSRAARSLRRALTDAGVTFIKFGQMLGTRADLLPAPFVHELSKLHSQVEAEPWKAIEPVLTDALDRPLDDVFTDLDHEPLAAASVAQIHTARLADGTDVVVKVQRPKARAQVTADLDILDRLAHRLERQTTWGRKIGAVGLAEGFADSLHEELDYGVELANMVSVAAASDLIVPTPYRDLSSEKVIVMQRIAGAPLSAAGDRLEAMSEAERSALADRLLGGVLKQIFVSGVFHADLHPGNVILTDDGDLALLDFGSVGRLDRPSRTSLVMLLHSVERQDSIAATDALLDLMDRPAGLDDRELERDLGRLILRYGDGSAPGGTGAIFAELLDVVVRHGFRVPPQLAAVFRTLGTLDGTLRLIDPDVDLFAIARQQGNALASQVMGREAIREQVDHQLATLLPMLARLPRRISRITEQIEDGSLSVNVRAFGNQTDRSYLAGIGSQLNLTLLGSAMGIGGLFLLTRTGGPMLLPTVELWPFIGVTLLFLAFTLGARVLASIFFSQRD